MRIASFTLGVLSIGALLFGALGCSTEQPGTTNTLGAYTSHVAATPEKTTSAAAKACADLKLDSIVSNGTAVDGKVTAKTADGQDVTIGIAQAGDNVSTVTIQVGATGDAAISRQLLDKLKTHLGWL